MGRRTGWVSVGALCATLLGAGGMLTASASVGSGERAVFVPITPCRIMDTRSGPDNVGLRNVPLGAGDTHSIAARGTNGNCTIPSDAVGLVLNVTAVNGTATSFLTVYPSDVDRPLAANLNWVAGQSPTPNAVTVRLSADGRVSFYNFAGAVDVVADVAGYYADHHFDDRYYTKAAVDALLATVQAQTATVQAQLAGKADEAAGPLVLGPSSFEWDGSPNTSYAQSFDFGQIWAANANGVCMSAPLVLPDHSIVTSLVLHAFDANGTSGVHVRLWADPAGSTWPTQLATGATTGAAGERTVTVTPAAPVTISNQTTSYLVDFCLDTNVQLQFEDVVVNYTLP